MSRRTVGARDAAAAGAGLAGADRLLAALALPPEARVDRRIPKKLLLEHGAPTAADRRQVTDGVEALTWAAVLKPATVGAPAYHDEVRDYAEIAVLVLALRPGARGARIAELVHRAVPYPVVLASAQEATVSLSLAGKRRSQAEAAAVVADAPVATPPFDPASPSPAESAFLADLALARQPAGDLRSLYDGWMARVTALLAARVTGRYASPAGSADGDARRLALDEYARLEREIAALVARAGRETQLARRVELNLELQRLRTRLGDVAATL